MMREAIIVDGQQPINVIVIPDGPEGDALLSKTCLEITDLDPKPGVGNGWTYVKGAFVASPPSPLTWDEIRAERDSRLAACDWTQVPDAPVDHAQWAEYRQQLRDIPQTFDNPDDVTWPEAP